jgi:CheY-like chemotaxis protein
MMKSVYVIDDDLDVRDIIVFALESSGFNVLSFSNGEEALKNLLDTPLEKLPGLIIVDYLMPIMDGVTFIDQVKTNGKKEILDIVLALSSAMGPMDPVLSEIKGIVHLPKPMELEDLLQLAKKHCS